VAQDVYFWPRGSAGDGTEKSVLRTGLFALGKALGLAGAARGAETWALKVDLGPANRPPAVDPAWTQAVADLLAGGGDLPRVAGSRPDTFAFDTLSITTAGLDAAGTHLALARAKGYATAADQVPYVVADGPDQGTALPGVLPGDSLLTEHTLAGGLAGAEGLCVLNPVRPHPHVGVRGAVTTLGVGLADRAGKIALHRNIRPQVDTPLCAGCGVCLTICLFDAIEFRDGRAFIDHKRCTGCGECMNVCFMAGISPAEASGIPDFQARVADAALAARDWLTGGISGRQAYFSFLVRLDRQDGGARSRNRNRLGDVGILASRDPVALDQATVDLISDRMGGRLSDWSGFNQLPAALLARAEAVGLGEAAYTLVTV